MFLGGLAKIRNVLWAVIQLLTFWNSYKKGKDGPDNDLTDTRQDQKEGEKKAVCHFLPNNSLRILFPIFSIGSCFSSFRSLDNVGNPDLASFCHSL